MKKNNNSEFDENMDYKEKRKSIDFKALANMDLGTLKVKLSKNLKKINKLSTPEKRRRVVAFDIGSSMIKIVEGMYYKKELVIYKYVSIPTPKDAIIDGEIKKEEELYDKLSKVLKQSGIKAKDAICSTNSTLIINREILIPKVEAEEMDTVVRYEIQQYLPINLEDYILQVTSLGEEEVNGNARINVRVTAYPEKIARGYYNLLQKLYLKPYALDVNYNAVNKFINYTGINSEFEHKSKEAVAFIDIGASFIDVNIYKDGQLDFTRIIKDGGNNIDEILLEQIGDPSEVTSFKQKNLNLKEELEPINMQVKYVVDDWMDKIEKII